MTEYPRLPRVRGAETTEYSRVPTYQMLNLLILGGTGTPAIFATLHRCSQYPRGVEVSISENKCVRYFVHSEYFALIK